MADGLRESLTRVALVEDVGDALAAQLMERWGGHRIPKRTEQVVSRETRDAAILADLASRERYTYQQVADRNYCSVATVWRVGKGVIHARGSTVR